MMICSLKPSRVAVNFTVLSKVEVPEVIMFTASQT